MNRSAYVIEQNKNTHLVVISACSGVTNLLVELANGTQDNQRKKAILSELKSIHFSVLDQLSDPIYPEKAILEILDDVEKAADAAALQSSDELTDRLVACGELMSTHLFTQLLIERGNSAVRFDIRTVLRTDSQFGRGEPLLEDISRLAQEKLVPLCQKHIVITQGFIGSDNDGNTTTLGRGGSDYSAALIAESVRACGLEIWTDVPGIYTTDPRIASAASPIPEISFSEASEMANYGAKILHPSTLLPALRHQIPVFVGSSKEPEKGGTWIKQTVNSSPLFRALTLRCNQTMVTLHSPNMFHAYGFLAEVFKNLQSIPNLSRFITPQEVVFAIT
ncbi:UNVERIFIED_CONTAM: hypothetical protein GTU68_056155 [Idotea baltica]|nr:hypothetical protein [Idotea baltica]